MVGKIFLVLFALASIGQVCPNPLTKEITGDQSPALKFRDIIFQIKSIDSSQMFNSIFSNFEEIYWNLISLLQSNSQPDILEVVDIFNNGLGARLLVVNEEYIEVDPRGVEMLFSNKARSMVKSVFPDNLFQQYMANEFLKKEIHRTNQQIIPEINARRVPLGKLNAAIADAPLAIRASNSSDIFTYLTSLLQTSVCNTIINEVYTQLNTTLTSATTYLDSISISSDDTLISMIASLISIGLDLAKESIAYVQELADTVVSNICGSSSSRKRRDLSAFQDRIDSVDVSRRDNPLIMVGQRAVAVRSANVLLALLASLVVAVITFGIVYLVTGGITTLVSLAFNNIYSSITSWVSSIFTSVFGSVFSVFSIFSWW